MMLEPMSLASLAGSAVTSFAGVMLIAAALPKLRDPGFADLIADYRLLPARAVRPVAALLPCVELALGLSLIAGIPFTAGRLASALLLLLFAAALGVNIARGRTHIDCGCQLLRNGARLHSAQPLANIFLAVLLAASVLAPAPDLVGQALGIGIGFTAFLFVLLVTAVAALPARTTRSR